MAFNFSGKTILVTGASKGIGRAIALALAESGCKVYALARNKDRLDSLAAENSNIIPIIQDLANRKETRAVLERLEVIDGLVNNAAIVQTPTPALEESDESLDKYLNINVMAAINCIQVIGKKMVEAGKKGSIVNISSINSQGAMAGLLGYDISKAALDMVTKQFALELGPRGIRVNSVIPTSVDTGIHDIIPGGLEAIRGPVVARMPMDRLATLEDIVHPTLYLLSDYAAMVTGSSHLVEGGWMCNILK